MEVSTDSQSSIVFEGSSQDPSTSGIVFAARRLSVDSVGTGNQQRGAQGTKWKLKWLVAIKHDLSLFGYTCTCKSFRVEELCNQPKQ